MPEQRMLKCRFCEYTVPAVIHRQDGSTMDGADMMVNHARHDHFKKIKNNLERKGTRQSRKIMADKRGEDPFCRPMPLDKIFR